MNDEEGEKSRFGRHGCILRRLGSLLGRLEAVLEQLGAILGRLGASSALLSCLGDYLGTFWALLETILGPSWVVLLVYVGRLEAFVERSQDEIE